MTEKRLLENLKKGDRSAFGAIFHKYESDIFFFSLDMMKNESEAEEILQETFVKLWMNRKLIDVDRNIRNYLISIAKNLIYNILKRKVVERKYLLNKTPSLAQPSKIENDLYLEDLRNLLLTSFNRLTPHQKEILTLKSEGLNNDEISEILGLSKRTIEDHISRSYKRLRSELPYPDDFFYLIMPLIYCLL